MGLRARARTKAKGRGSNRARHKPPSAPGRQLTPDFRLLIDSSPLMIWLSDADNRGVYFNQTWLEFTGRPLAEELGDGWIASVHPEDRERFEEEERAGFATRRPFRIEYRLRRNDGAYRWILDQFTPRKDASGRFAGYFGSCTDISDLHDATAGISRWQRRFEAALNASGWIAYELDLATNRVEWSPAIESLLGHRPVELRDALGWVNYCVHPDDRARVREEFSRVAPSGGLAAMLYRVRHREGHYLWLEDRIFFIGDRDLEQTRYIGFVSDVSERVRHEEELRRSEERLRLAIDAVNGGVYSYDFLTERMECSGRLLEELGFGPGGDRLTRQAWLERTHPDDRERVREIISGSNSRQPVHAQYRVCTPAGNVVHVLTRVTLIRDADGSPQRVIGCLVDVSAMHLAEEALRLSEERFRLAAEAVDGIVYEIDVRAGTVTSTGRLLQRLGYGDLTAITRDAWAELLHPDDRVGAIERYEALLRARAGTTEAEYRVRDTHGNYRYLLDRMLIRGDAGGEPERVVGCAVDITSQKQAEHQILELNAELEQRVEERTAALQAAVEELEAFTYSVSHDLRAPLRHVAGFTDLLRARLREPDAQVQRYLETIAGATARMAEMIDKLLTLSRVGRGEMHPSAVDLGELVAEVRDELAPALDGRTVEWRVGKLPVVRADRALLRGAMQNLLANAVKFTAGRAPAIIEVAARGGEREHEIVVRDNGAGFDMRYVNKLFGVFQRLHAPGEFEGTGIGLASVRRIINRHGGRVWAQGKPGAGAEFHFTLPAREEQ